MKILAVSDFFPWPTTKGGLIRAATAVEALSKLGELDLFSFYDARIPFGDVPTDVRLVGLATTPYPRPSWSRRWKARSVLHRGVPLRVALRTYDPQPRVDFDAFAADRSCANNPRIRRFTSRSAVSIDETIIRNLRIMVTH